MREKKILELFNNANDEYINEANPQNKKQYKHRINFVAMAASLLVLLMGGFCIFHFIQTPNAEKYYATSLDEVASAYEGVLLTSNISFEGSDNTKVLLCYNGEEPIDSIQYGDTSIQIYQGETTPEFELTYYAVFEYQNVYYELKIYSNDEKFIYEMLQAVLGETEDNSERTSNGEHNFTEVLGYSDYYVTVEQTMPGFIVQKYYTIEDGIEICIAQVFGYVVPEPEVYSKDLDGDGVNELICNCIAGTGTERVYIFRNNNGVIEKGYLSYDLWDSTMFEGITNRGSSYIRENYIVETNTFEIEYPTETGSKTIVIEDMDIFEFEKFVEEF